MENPVATDHVLVVETLILTQTGGSWRLTVHAHRATLVSQQVANDSVPDFCCSHLPFLALCGQGCVRCFGSSCTYYASSGKIKEITTWNQLRYTLK
jgi:hypothetical protein